MPELKFISALSCSLTFSFFSFPSFSPLLLFFLSFHHTRSFLFIYFLIFGSLQSFCSGPSAVACRLIDRFVRPRDSLGSLSSMNERAEVRPSSLIGRRLY